VGHWYFGLFHLLGRAVDQGRAVTKEEMLSDYFASYRLWCAWMRAREADAKAVAK